MAGRGPLNRSGALGPVHVLVVGDAPEVREMVVETLQESGARVTEAKTADEALVLLEQERPDVLLSDCDMPGHDGLWLIEQVRKLPAERGGTTPAACLTRFISPEDLARVLRAGFQYHIPKPFRTERLRGIVTILALKP